MGRTSFNSYETLDSNLAVAIAISGATIWRMVSAKTCWQVDSKEDSSPK